jgi:hypothetical protein
MLMAQPKGKNMSFPCCPRIACHRRERKKRGRVAASTASHRATEEVLERVCSVGVRENSGATRSAGGDGTKASASYIIPKQIQPTRRGTVAGRIVPMSKLSKMDG